MAKFRSVQVLVIVLWIVAVNTKHNHKKAGNSAECGRPIGSYSAGKIVGGYDVGYFKYPWYVALMRNDVVYCGSTLIASRYVLTAAHCYQPYFKAVKNGLMKYEQIFKPMFGVYNVCRHETTQKEFGISKVFVHEKYEQDDPYSDIAMIKLNTDAKGFEPCCLPTKVYDEHSRPKESFISGLGDQSYHAKKGTCTMHEARVLIYDDTACRKMLDEQEEGGSNLRDAFCAGYLQGGIDTCQGDSGGPLIIATAGGRFTLLGITSFGFDCAIPNALGVYTDVSRYMKWIQDRMKAAPVSPQPPTPKPPRPIATTSSPDEPTTSSWDLYPVTSWDSFTTLADPPLAPVPHDSKPVSVTFVLNFYKKRRAELMKKNKSHLHKKLRSSTSGN